MQSIVQESEFTELKEIRNFLFSLWQLKKDGNIQEKKNPCVLFSINIFQATLKIAFFNMNY